MGLPELPKLERSAEGDKMEILVDDVDVVINKGSVREDEMKMDIDSNESQKESSGEQMDEDGDIEMENESAEEGSQIRSRQRIRLTFQSKEVKKTFRTIVERMEGGC